MCIRDRSQVFEGQEQVLAKVFLPAEEMEQAVVRPLLLLREWQKGPAQGTVCVLQQPREVSPVRLRGLSSPAAVRVLLQWLPDAV